MSARASLAPSERPNAVAAEHRELLAAIRRGDRALAGRIAVNHATATASAASPRAFAQTKEHEHVPQSSI